MDISKSYSINSSNPLTDLIITCPYHENTPIIYTCKQELCLDDTLLCMKCIVDTNCRPYQHYNHGLELLSAFFCKNELLNKGNKEFSIGNLKNDNYIKQQNEINDLILHMNEIISYGSGILTNEMEILVDQMYKPFNIYYKELNFIKNLKDEIIRKIIESSSNKEKLSNFKKLRELIFENRKRNSNKLNFNQDIYKFNSALSNFSSDLKQFIKSKILSIRQNLSNDKANPIELSTNNLCFMMPAPKSEKLNDKNPESFSEFPQKFPYPSKDMLDIDIQSVKQNNQLQNNDTMLNSTQILNSTDDKQIEEKLIKFPISNTTIFDNPCLSDNSELKSLLNNESSSFMIENEKGILQDEKNIHSNLLKIKLQKCRFSKEKSKKQSGQKHLSMNLRNKSISASSVSKNETAVPNPIKVEVMTENDIKPKELQIKIFDNGKSLTTNGDKLIFNTQLNISFNPEKRYKSLNCICIIDITPNMKHIYIGCHNGIIRLLRDLNSTTNYIYEDGILTKPINHLKCIIKMHAFKLLTLHDYELILWKINKNTRKLDYLNNQVLRYKIICYRSILDQYLIVGYYSDKSKQSKMRILDTDNNHIHMLNKIKVNINSKILFIEIFKTDIDELNVKIEADSPKSQQIKSKSKCNMHKTVRIIIGNDIGFVYIYQILFCMKKNEYYKMKNIRLINSHKIIDESDGELCKAFTSSKFNDYFFLIYGKFIGCFDINTLTKIYQIIPLNDPNIIIQDIYILDAVVETCCIIVNKSSLLICSMKMNSSSGKPDFLFNQTLKDIEIMVDGSEPKFQIIYNFDPKNALIYILLLVKNYELALYQIELQQNKANNDELPSQNLNLCKSF